MLARRSAIVLALVVIVSWLGMAFSFAHDPHQSAVTVEWDALHMKGTRSAVTHEVGTQFDFAAYAKTSWTHNHTLRAEIFFARRTCVLGICTWNTLTDLQAEAYGSSVRTEPLIGVVECDSQHKFYSKHRNVSHDTAFQSIDEAEGVQTFTVSCDAGS